MSKRRFSTSIVVLLFVIPFSLGIATAKADIEVPKAAWGEAVNGLRWRAWVQPKEVHEGDPIVVTMEFQNVSDAPMRVYKKVTVDKCLFPAWREADGLRYCVEIEHVGERPVPLAETVELAPNATHRCTHRETTGGVKPGPTSLWITYDAPRNTNPEVQRFWTGRLHMREPLVFRVTPRPAPPEPLDVRAEQSRRDLEQIGSLLLAHRKEHGAWPGGPLRDFLKGKGREELLVCRASGHRFLYDPGDPREPLVFSIKWIRDNRAEWLALDESGKVALRVFRELPDRKTVEGWIDVVAVTWRTAPEWKSGLRGAIDVNFRDLVFEEVQRLGCANYTTPIDKAYPRLGIGNRNVHCFAAIDNLANQRAIWCLATGLAHPSVDVRIRCAKALGSPHHMNHFPVVPLLEAARRNAFLLGGGENATIHAIYQHALADALNAHTWRNVKLKPGQDPEGLKAGIAAWEKWVRNEAPAVQDLMDRLTPRTEAADKESERGKR